MTITVAAPTFEHHRVAQGIGEPRPRVTWVVDAPPGWSVAWAEIECDSPDGRLSYVLPVTDTVLVPWPFAALRSRQQLQLRVRVRGRDETDWSAWSPAASVEAGLLEAGEWTAAGIGLSGDGGSTTPRRAALLRGEFAVTKPVARARLYASAHGVYEVELNGRRVGDEVLAPGWTSYHYRLAYSTHDVTALVADGDNVVGTWLADGWYRGRLGFDGGYIDNYGTETALLAQLVIDHPDGSTTTFGSGPSWTSHPSPIVSTGLLEGESYDARAELPGWSAPGFDDAGWIPVAPRPFDTSALFAPLAPPIRRVDTVEPVSVERRPDGRVVLDFGQNLVGRLELTVHGPAGRVIQIRHAEILQGGELHVAPLRGAASIDQYVVRGDPQGERWEPRFTIHGFRYAEISGWDGPVDGRIVARVIHSDMVRTGWFDCSDPLLNRLHENVVWSMRGNFVGLPTDCPQRDERLGWTGDIQVFSPTSAYLYDCSGLLFSWLRDLSSEQSPDGTVPWYVPVIPGGEQWTPIRPGAGWGDAAAIMPWDLYRAWGDTTVAVDQLDSARAWVDLVAGLAGEDQVWDSGYQLGDWLDPSAPPDDPAAGSTDRYLVASAYFARSTQRLAQLSDLVGAADTDFRRDLAAAVRAAFRARYRVGAGWLANESQTAYALAIVFELFDADERAAAGERLAALVDDAGMRLTTGFLGTPAILDALTMGDQRVMAHRLLQQTESPSWLWPVTQDATTIWERWDSMRADGTVNPGGMTSFNHYAFGSVADWMHRELAGLAPVDPGWRTICFRPGVESGLLRASGAFLSPRGRVAISWSVSGDDVEVTVEVPTGATAIVELPDGRKLRVESGRHDFRSTSNKTETGQN